MRVLRGRRFRIATIALAVLFILAAGYLFTMPTDTVAQTKKPLYKGTFYSATRGGHMVFTDITIDPNTDMVTGSVTGRLPIPNNEQADALEMSPDQKYIYYPTWDSSMLYTIDITDRKNPKVVAEKKIHDKATRHCGSYIGPDGKLYLSSMKQGDIHKVDISNPIDPKLMDTIYKHTYLCGVQMNETQKDIWVTDMKEHKVYIYDAKTSKLVKEIQPGGKEFLHRSRFSPDGKLFYQSSTGTTTPEADGKVYIIDTKKKKVIDTIMLGETYDAHDTALTPDGKYAIIAVRRVPAKEFKDSEYVVVNLETKRKIGSVSTCKSCHNSLGIDPSAEGERQVFICGVQAAWQK
jgi:DNA-binding beta-propeller fold protein YncE